ncbi:hypothetical protein RIF29_30217 [Crotalaria pallida]|uniref:Uncharacterized protein n=1 Tax=Crotalaria pallida TaxID=3830 RepID=A0AAN9EFY6_CROPI
MSLPDPFSTNTSVSSVSLKEKCISEELRLQSPFQQRERRDVRLQAQFRIPPRPSRYLQENFQHDDFAKIEVNLNDYPVHGDKFFTNRTSSSPASTHGGVSEPQTLGESRSRLNRVSQLPPRRRSCSTIPSAKPALVLFIPYHGGSAPEMQ